MMPAWQEVLAVLLGMALTACAQPAPPDSSVQPSAAAGSAGAATVPDEPSSRFIGVIGSRTRHAPPFLGVSETNFFVLRSFVDRQTGEARHQLYVSDSYSGAERRWYAAREPAGRPFRVIEISRAQISCDGGCSYAEEFAADIPEGELRANTQGLMITFTARSGAEKTITVPGSQIAAQLAAVDARRKPAQPAGTLTEPTPPLGSTVYQ
jgi:hypothetical protein